MKINSINLGVNTPKNKISLKNNSNPLFLANNQTKNTFSFQYFNKQYANNYSNISFWGNAPQIKNACIITGEEKDLPLLVTKKNDSYIVEFDSQTEIIYGIDAQKYLDNLDYFEYETQIIFPKKAKGEITLENGKTIKADENSAILINEGTKAKVKVKQGYPFVIVSKKDFDWYERHKNNAKNQDIRNKFLELMYYNSKLYNCKFTTNIFLDESLSDEDFLKGIGIDKWKERNNLVNALYKKKSLLSEEDREKVEKIKKLHDKLYDCNLIDKTSDNYIRFKVMPKFEYIEKELLDRGFNNEELEMLRPIYEKARKIRINAKIVHRNKIEDYNKELVEKMKQQGFLYKNKKYEDKYIYWKEFFGNEHDLRSKLQEKGFSVQEQDETVSSWKKSSLAGFDATGLKFIDENIAIYDLKDKLNNWTQEKTEWITNSTVLTSSEGKAPFIGASLVQTDKERVIPIGELRKGEKLHAHPNLEEKRQTEVYLVTSGACALNIVKNNKSDVKILKQGDLAVVGPGVKHCVNSILGEYEHIVVQIPSAFQYGFSFKSIVDPPEDYDSQKLEQEAFELLSGIK